MSSDKRILLSQFKVGKGEKTPDCSREKRTKARLDNKCKKSVSDW